MSNGLWLRLKGRLLKNVSLQACAPARTQTEDTNFGNHLKSVKTKNSIMTNDLNFGFLIEGITFISIRVLEKN